MFYQMTYKISIILVLLLPEGWYLRYIFATYSFISEIRAQSFSAQAPPQIIELAVAGKILSSNFFFSTKRQLTNPAQCDGTRFSSSRNQLFLIIDAFDLLRCSDQSWAYSGSWAPIFEKYTSDRFLLLVQMPIFWHSISQLSSIIWPI